MDGTNWYIEAQGKLNSMRFRDLERTLQQLGFMNQGRRGPHFKFCNPTNGRCVAVPGHREIPVGTVRSIIRQMQMVPADFQQAVRAASSIGPVIKLAADPLMNIRMLVDSVQQQMAMLKKDPRFHQHFVSAQIQGLFVSCDAAVHKCLELCARYKDYKGGMDRMNAAGRIVHQLVGELGRRTGFNLSGEPVVKNIFEDMLDIYRELTKITRMNPPQAQPASRQPKPVNSEPLAMPAPQTVQMPSQPPAARSALG